METKVCTGCRIAYPATLEYFSPKRNGGLAARCKACRRVEGKNYRRKNRGAINARKRQTVLNNPSKYLSANLKCLCGISFEGYQALFLQQNGVCAICGTEHAGENQHGKHRLVVDHDHKTNKVRGLLCCNCNFILGHAKDDASILLKAIMYLRNNDNGTNKRQR